MKFVFIKNHLVEFPVKVCCEVLGVSRSGYHACLKRPASARAQRREELAGKVKEVFEANRRVYGSPRVYEVLKAQDVAVPENTVADIMKECQIRAKSKKKFIPRTTNSRHESPVVENILDREFTAELPNQKWVVDITYIPTDEGWLYLAGVRDLFSRKIVGWSMAGHMRTESWSATP